MFDFLKKFLRRQTAPQQPGGSWYLWPYAHEAGVTVTYETAMTFDAVYACIRWLSSMVSILPWDLYEKTGERKRTQLHNDTSWLIEQQPNPELNTFQFRELLMLWAPTWGNGYAEIERSNLTGKVLNLWPISPDRVCVKRERPGGELYYEVSNPFGGENRKISPRDMFHVRGPGYDGMQGYSIIALAARTIGMGIALEKYGGNFFGSGARPSGLLYLEGHADPERIKKLRDDWNQAYSGENSNKTAVVPKGLKWEPVSVSNSDAKFVEVDAAIVRKVCRWFGVPPHKVFDLEDAHFSNIEHQSIEAVTDSLMPWIVRFELEFNGKILGRNQQGRQYSKMNVNGLLRGDSAARANYYKTLLMAGVLSINDVLELEDRNDIGPLGDDRYMQMQMTTIERVSDGSNLKDAAKPEPEEGDGEEMPGEPATRTDEPMEPLTIRVDREQDERRKTSTDSAAAQLSPMITSAFERLIRQESHKAEQKLRGRKMDRETKVAWIGTLTEQQRQAAIVAFEPIAAVFGNLTETATDASDWVSAYVAGVPVRADQAASRTDPESWYRQVESTTVAELVGGTMKAWSAKQ